MRVERCGPVLCVDGRFRFLLGVNYWPRLLNIRMWRDWDEEAIRRDVEEMRRLGLRAARVFLLNRDFGGADGRPLPNALEKLRRLLDMFAEAGIGAFVTFLVGHMSGENWPIPWAPGNEVYRPEAIEGTCRFVEGVVKAFANHPGVAGWILSNELSFVKKAGSRGEALALLRAFSATVRSIDRGHVVSSGDVPWSPLQETPNIRGLVDYAGPHLYLYDTDSARHGYRYGAAIEVFSDAGALPVILEEFGFSTHQYSEESHARFINEVLYTALAHGASGAFIWCFSDFPHESDPPYEWRPLELGFGLLRSDGSPKPAAEAVKRFAELLRRVEDLGLHTRFRRAVEASVIIPFYTYRSWGTLRYGSELGHRRILKPVEGALILAAAAGIGADAVYEPELERVLGERSLVITPSTVVALASTWRRLLGFVERGGALYTSLLRGADGFLALHESPTHLWRELFGVENVLEAGSFGKRLRGEAELRFLKGFGPFRAGDSLRISIPVEMYTYRVRPVDAEVIAVDSEGDPVLTVARRGRGVAILLTVPIELVFMLSEDPWSPGLHRIYEAIADEAGIATGYRVSTPLAEVQVYRGEGADLLILVNHGRDTEAVLRTPRDVRRLEVVGGDAELLSFAQGEARLRLPAKGGWVALARRS